MPPYPRGHTSRPPGPDTGPQKGPERQSGGGRLAGTLLRGTYPEEECGGGLLNCAKQIALKKDFTSLTTRQADEAHGTGSKCNRVVNIRGPGGVTHVTRTLNLIGGEKCASIRVILIP